MRLRNGHSGVHVGQDGWLFWVGRADELLAFYRDGAPTARLLARWARLVERRAARCASLGARYLQIVVPEKLAIYDHRLGAPLVDPGRAPALRLGELVRGSPATDAWIDLVGPMRRARDDAELYHRTDTHWTLEGCTLAYREICRACGVQPLEHASATPPREVEQVLDLGGKLDPPVPERVRTYWFVRRAERTVANALVSFRESTGREDEAGLHVGSRVAYRNESPSAHPARVILFGDSYSDHRGFLLAAMLAETFCELHFVWSSSLDWTYIERVRPDIVIHEAAERFLRRVPMDRLAVDLYAAARVARARARSLLRRVLATVALRTRPRPGSSR